MDISGKRCPAAVPAGAAAAVRDALRAEPEPETRESMEQLLSAWDTGMMS